ncbi:MULTISPECIES: serine hydrolase [unclassified Streptomyces]|uniref:serine hydrolase n=1 Tax=unclassified Streptomyces TaxID=2593676 RepID=UPI0036E202B5
MESSRARRGHRARARRHTLMSTALASVAIVGATAGGTVYVQARAHSGTASVSSSTSPTVGSAGGEATVEPVAEASAEPVADLDALLADAMAAVTVPDAAELSVAVLELDSGQSATYGDGVFDTASIVKVDILAALLLQAQDDGRQLTAAEKSYASAMIESSDNASASALWRLIGAAEGLDAANERLGLTGTEGGDGMLWGLTRTTAADQLTLLRQVFGDGSELREASRTYLRTLMGRIAADQHWGVSAAADGSAWALKNGWLPRSTTGLWDINSIGRVTTANGTDCLVVVLSNGNATKERGIALVEAAARAAVSVFTDGSAASSASAAVSR